MRRWVKILKARGVPIRLPKMYFKIVDGRGPVPYILREVVLQEAGRVVRAKVEKFRRVKDGVRVFKPLVGKVTPGTQVLILYPPGSDANRAFTIAQIALDAKLGFNTVVITYSLDPLDFFKMSLATALGAGVFSCVEEGVREFEKYIKFVGINLSMFDIDLLQYCEVSDAYTSPETDVVIVLDMKALYDYLGDVRKFNRIQYTFANWDRALGTVSIRYFPDVPEVRDLVLSELSDIIIKLVPSTTTPRTVLHYRMLLTKSYLSTLKEVPVSKVIESLKEVAGLAIPPTQVIVGKLSEVEKWLESSGHVPRCVVRNWGS